MQKIKAMLNDFINNRKTYFVLEQFWTLLFYSVLIENKIVFEEWITPFYNTYYNNQEKDMDENPVFSAKSVRTGRIIRIVQSNDEQDIFDSWDDNFDGNDELVIYLTWSNKNIENAKSLISSWLKNTILR